MSCKSHATSASRPSFTTREIVTDESADAAMKTRTKRFTFYWQVGPDGPVLLRATDIDGTDVTDDVEPPPEMYERVRQNRNREL